jgi:isoquinoline 1-oxidoreductase beta subunit
VTRPIETPPSVDVPHPSGIGRRRFLAYLVAGPTLAVAVRYGLLDGVAIAVPGSPEPADQMDLGDFLILAARGSEPVLIVLVAEEDGTVSCALPREEVGQGITTSVAMLIADELGLPLSRVRVTLADARRELGSGQLTGGSNTIRSVFEPIKAAAAAFRGRMGGAGAAELGVPASSVVLRDGAVVATDGRSVGFGALAVRAGDPALAAPEDAPATSSDGPLVGTPQNRVDALAMVTGRMKYTNDLDPITDRTVYRSMVRRSPTIRGRVQSVDNLDAVKAMPGVRFVEVIDLSRIAMEDFEVVESGVAVVADTFGQALDAKEALEVTWDLGPLAEENDASIRSRLRAIQPPLTPAAPGSTAVDGEFDVAFASHAPLESNTAIADVRGDTATIWAGLKTPVVAGETIADELGLDPDKVTVHVVQGGGSFGRRLFFDSAIEAATISQRVDAPVKHMWTRIDDMRHGRARAATHHRMRYTHAGPEVLSFENRIAGVETDFRHGLGDLMSANGSQINPPSAIPIAAGGNASYAQSVFYLTVHSPYETGATSQSLEELSLPFNTGSWRSVYSASARGTEEIMVDRLAASMGEDPAALRLRLLPDERQRAVVQKAMDLGQWGKAMPAGFAQGIAYHEEYKSLTAIVVELDGRDPSDPRVTRASIAADYGLPINPRGLEAQLLGGLTDAVATTLRTGLHLEEGLFLEGSYSQFHYPRQRDVPTDVEIFVFPETTGRPGGAGELGVPAAVGAIANAYARATGTTVTNFPIIFPVDFEPFTKGTGSTRVNPR